MINLMGSIIVPDMGGKSKEARIVKWLKNHGDAVSIGEVLGELEMDKANVEMEAEETGFLSIHAGPGTKVRVGQTIADIFADADKILPAPVDLPFVAPKAPRPPSKPDLILSNYAFWLAKDALLVGRKPPTMRFEAVGLVICVIFAFERLSAHSYISASICAACAGTWGLMMLFRKPASVPADELISIDNGHINIGGSPVGDVNALEIAVKGENGWFHVVARPRNGAGKPAFIWQTLHAKHARRLRDLIASMIQASAGTQWPPAPKQG